MDKNKPFIRKNVCIFLIIILLLITSILGLKCMKIERCLGGQIEQIALTITEGSKILGICETEQEQNLVIEMMQVTLLEDVETLNSIIDSSYFFRDYNFDSILYYFLDLRLKYSDNPNKITQALNRISKVIGETEILEYVKKDKYSYLFDSADVKGKIDTIASACE